MSNLHYVIEFDIKEFYDNVDHSKLIKQIWALGIHDKELIYVIEGKGTLNFENKRIEFSKGDSILIEPNEKYYYDTNYCIVSMTCTPAWLPEQHKLVD